MGVLMVKCPTSGQEYSTGIQIEEDSLERLPQAMARSRCPHCGGEHIWWTRESHISEEGVPAEEGGADSSARGG
jgi:hypothetical protein